MSLRLPAWKESDSCGGGEMGARGGLYFSTWSMSSQRHDRPAGQVSAQIRLGFHPGSRSKKERIGSFKHGWYERNQKKWKYLLDMCYVSHTWPALSSNHTGPQSDYTQCSLPQHLHDFLDSSRNNFVLKNKVVSFYMMQQKWMNAVSVF